MPPLAALLLSRARLPGLWPLVAAAALAAMPCAQAARFDFDAAGGRLPKDVRPSLYRLVLDVDPGRPTFTGTADIEIDVRRPVPAIVLNADRLQASRARLIDAGGAERSLEVVPDAALQQWRLVPSPAGSVAPGAYRLRIEYAGQVQTSGQGLFVVPYEAQGQPARMLATQFEPGHARKMFPSFDEPAFRASVQLTARAPERYEAVSNMPVAGSSVTDGVRETRFGVTPSMPTYLVALAVGEFEALVDRQDGVELRILTARGKSESAAYAMAATKRLLPFFRDYFGTPYALPKLDQLAVPGVRWGAMEDWGLISYNEAALLFDPARSSPRNQVGVFNVIAHEIAHQWFGNLVTAAWWDDLWLNEAFATWMADKASKHFNPQWDLGTAERAEKETAMRRDAGGATRPVVIPVVTESEAFNVFDEITYQKGGSVLSMFESAIGEATFREGLRSYIAAHAYSNATADDLWHFLSQAAGRDLTGEIAGWIRQPGFPVLDVATRCAGGRTEVRLAQQRFTSTSMKDLVAMWHVPVVLRGGSQTRALVLGREPASTSFTGCVPVVANAGDTGYYRVRYDAASRAQLRKAYATLPALDRAALTADSFALAFAGALPMIDALDLVALPAERSPNEWLLILDSLERLDEALAGTPAQPAFRAWARGRRAPVLDRLGWAAVPQEPLPAGRLRSAMINALGAFDHGPTIARARQAFAAGRTDPTTLNGILYTVARHADATTLDTLLAQRKAATGQEEQFRLNRAFTLVRDPALVLRILDLTLTPTWDDNAASWIATHGGEGSGHPALGWTFVERNFDALAKKTGDWGRLWILPNAASGFNEGSRADALLAAQEARLGADGRDAALRVAERIRQKAAVREREGDRLAVQLRTAPAHRAAMLAPSR